MIYEQFTNCMGQLVWRCTHRRSGWSGIGPTQELARIRAFFKWWDGRRHGERFE